MRPMPCALRSKRASKLPYRRNPVGNCRYWPSLQTGYHLHLTMRFKQLCSDKQRALPPSFRSHPKLAFPPRSGQQPAMNLFRWTELIARPRRYRTPQSVRFHPSGRVLCRNCHMAVRHFLFGAAAQPFNQPDPDRTCQSRRRRRRQPLIVDFAHQSTNWHTLLGSRLYEHVPEKRFQTD